MATEKIPIDIQQDADRLYPYKETHFSGMNFDSYMAEREAYIQGRMDERAKDQEAHKIIHETD